MTPRPLVTSDENERDGSAMSAQLQANFDALKKRKLNEHDQRQVAQETAHLVASEIQHLRQAVAELEAMLTATTEEGSTSSSTHDSDDDDGLDDLPEKNPFPLLPPNVVAIPDSRPGGGSLDGAADSLDVENCVESDLEGDEDSDEE